MFNLIKSSILLSLCSCKTTELTPDDTTVNRTDEFQQQIDRLISRDADNKKWARIYLHEIDQSITNDDMAAYVFYVKRYEETPLEMVPEHLRNEPGYVPGPSELELFFRLRWFEQACKLHMQHNKLNDTTPAIEQD